MATPGLSLVGFMARDEAINYLSRECAPANPDPAVLEAEWQVAKARILAPVGNAGNPSIRAIPATHDAYVQQLKNGPEWQGVFAANPHWEIKFIEAAPLLAYQFAILNRASSSHGAQLGLAPSVDDLLKTCLPLSPTAESFSVVQTMNSVLVQTRSLNVRPQPLFMPQPGTFVLQVGGALPFAHVVRFKERSYLHNGYHRAVAALAAGSAEIPCVFRDVATEAEIGIGPGTFDLQALEAANPPTLHHYASGQAHPVDLVIKTRTIHLTYTDWVTPEI